MQRKSFRRIFSKWIHVTVANDVLAFLIVFSTAQLVSIEINVARLYSLYRKGSCLSWLAVWWVSGLQFVVLLGFVVSITIAVEGGVLHFVIMQIPRICVVFFFSALYLLGWTLFSVTPYNAFVGIVTQTFNLHSNYV